MKKVPFENALTEAQEWVGQNEIYAVGESLNKKGEKVIMVFAQDTVLASKLVSKELKGYEVIFHQSDAIQPQQNEQE